MTAFSAFRTISAALKVVRDDIRSAFINDPAARKLSEVLLYPGLHAILFHRLSHHLFLQGIPFFPRLLSQVARFFTGIEIHPGAHIGRGFFIDHGMGVVIGETSHIGDWVTLYQGVTLGGTGKQCGKRHPTLHNYVVVGVGASVLGDITIGEGARVGGGAVVVKDVPPHTTAVGIPARIVVWRDPTTGETRRLERLPDPEGAMLRSLHDKVIEMENRLNELEDFTDHHVFEEQQHHLQLSKNLWSILDDYSNGNGKSYDEEFIQGTGI
jgi:serine O-acetyltransferase